MSYLMAYKIFSLLMLAGLLLLLWQLHAASRRLRAEIKELEAQAERDGANDPDSLSAAAGERSLPSASS